MTSRLHSSGIAALSFTFSASLLAAALAPSVAHAATTGVEPVEVTIVAERQVTTKRVSTADLDLTSAADLKRLNARVLGAIGQVCDAPGEGRTTINEHRCRYDARLSSDRQIAALRNNAIALANANGGVAASSDIIVAAR